MRERLNRFMQGRYGNDGLNTFLFIMSFALCIIYTFVRIRPLYIIGVVFLVLGYFRMMSRNYYKRSAESIMFYRIIDRIGGFFKGIFGRGASRNRTSMDYRIYKCPRCRQKLRVPCGKGRIMITCKRCGNEFIKRT